MKVIIAGCGYLGLAAARLLHGANWEVIGLTHTGDSAAALAGEPFRVMACDVSDRAAVERLAGEVGGGADAVLHCASSGKGDASKYREVYFDGVVNLAEVLSPGRLVFCGSTSVYAQTDGGWVTEESTAEPGRETGRILRETEEFVLGRSGAVGRLAGIYGPGRSVLLRKFFSGEAVIEGDGRRWVNQIHRDDGASALALLVAGGGSGIFNVADDCPVPQIEIYEWLAARFGRERPPFGPVNENRKRGVTNKRVSNAKLRGLGWKLKYPSFTEAVAMDPELEKKAQ